MVVNDTKICERLKNKSLLSIEKILQDETKYYSITTRKCFNVEKFASS